MFARLCFALLLLLALAHADSSLARGWGDHINWVTRADAPALAAAEGKPIMFIVHKTWCGACKRLKPKVADSKAIADLASKFIMVNLQDDEEPSEASFKPDGGYIPRVLFAAADGVPVSDIYNEGGNEKYKYFYSSDDEVLRGMNRALAYFEQHPISAEGSEL